MKTTLEQIQKLVNQIPLSERDKKGWAERIADYTNSPDSSGCKGKVSAEDLIPPTTTKAADAAR